MIRKESISFAGASVPRTVGLYERKHTIRSVTLRNFCLKQIAAHSIISKRVDVSRRTQYADNKG